MTFLEPFSRIIAPIFQRCILNSLKIISLNIKKASPEDIGKLYAEGDALATKLALLKNTLGLQELMYLSTCNRTEFLIKTNSELDENYLKSVLLAFNDNLGQEEIADLVGKLDVYEGSDAILHLTNVASSLDSMVVGEREIITQVRNAYDFSKALGLTGDLLRLVVRHSIVTAKKIYSGTDIAKHPVSVVSLAYRKLRELNIDIGSRLLIIGAGQTNTAMAKYLKKHGFNNLVVFNRTLANAQLLAEELNGQAFSLAELGDKGQGFEVIITCTGASDYIITEELYAQMLNGDTDRKLVIDLAVPADFDPEIAQNSNINLVAINNLKDIAESNLKQRKGELVQCQAIIDNALQEFKKIYKQRQVELAMSEVPDKVKEIVNTAVNTVYAKDVEKLDTAAKETLDKVLNYVERKYISVPMKIAKEVLLDKS
ncbi:MAG TPA: glutamyl-tRNA reductase [Flavobacteriales bacterium]|nr:glutamyl-tRNA reductase [Flavobacteriales bacterium]